MIKTPVSVETGLPLPATAVAVWPFLIVTRNVKSCEIQQGELGIRQQGELFVLPYLVIFALFWLIRTLQLGSSDLAYHAVPFVREIARNRYNPTYLSLREKHGWLRHVRL